MSATGMSVRSQKMVSEAGAETPMHHHFDVATPSVLPPTLAKGL